jgi:Protein of unknown function DUF262
MSDIWNENDSMLQWNEDIESDLEPGDFLNTVIFSRDWTVETIINQITSENIDLNPAFQRRNAWSDEKRSLLMESFLMGVPVPQIVLAEDTKSKRRFLILDGKQRLMTLVGFFMPDRFPYWRKPILTGLDVMKDLNGKSGFDILNDAQSLRLIYNADVRTSVISNYAADDVLYSIFYRINAGSVPLSTQELRQSLYPGEFTKFTITATENRLPIHDILNLDANMSSDDKFRDVEMLLHYLSFKYYFPRYHGNLKSFLDTSLANLNFSWSSNYKDIESDFERFNYLCGRMIEVFGGPRKVARKVGKRSLWESSFNKSLFDALIYYFDQLNDSNFDGSKYSDFIEIFRRVFENPEFRASIESTTKSKANYDMRYNIIGNVFEEAFQITVKRPRI